MHGSGLGYVRYMGTARVMMQHTRAMYVRVGVYAWLQWNMYCCVDCVNVFGRLYWLIQWWYVVVEFSGGIGFDGGCACECVHQVVFVCAHTF